MWCWDARNLARATQNCSDDDTTPRQREVLPKTPVYRRLGINHVDIQACRAWNEECGVKEAKIQKQLRNTRATTTALDAGVSCCQKRPYIDDGI